MAGAQVATYCLAMVDFGIVLPDVCMRELNSDVGLRQRSSTRGLGSRLQAMLAGRASARAQQASEPDFSHFTRLDMLSVVWPWYLRTLAASREPLTEVFKP